jgi:purine-binding chemotaxis protein CheW
MNEDMLVLVGLASETLALPLSAVESIERPGRFTQLPFAAPWLRGVTAVRGEIVSVVDLGRFDGRDPAGTTPSARLLVTRGAGTSAALLVDCVHRIVNGPERADVAPEAALSRWCAGGRVIDGQAVPVLDPARLMTSDEFQAFQNLS